MIHYGFIGIIILILDIIAIVSVIAGHGTVGHKILWTLLVLLLPLIGMILYFLIGRSAADA
ncbi:MAG: PLDc N-terminal domain-containing protein [Desulfoferrobacter sp.]